jgi:F-type H+-transporting ATPase subunit b
MALLGITDIGINLPVLIAQTVNFIVLLVVLRLVAYKPIMRLLDERARRIREGLSQAEASKERAAEADRAAREQIESARREGQQIIAQAQQVASRLQEESRQQAQAQAEALLERARAEIQLERDGAVAALRREFADLTIAAAEKVIEQSLDRAAHQRLIERVLAESRFQDN